MNANNRQLTEQVRGRGGTQKRNRIVRPVYKKLTTKNLYKRKLFRKKAPSCSQMTATYASGANFVFLPHFDVPSDQLVN